MRNNVKVKQSENINNPDAFSESDFTNNGYNFFQQSRGKHTGCNTNNSVNSYNIDTNIIPLKDQDSSMDRAIEIAKKMFLISK